ncbi:hypothetical protein [Meiothermus taiwanensis]|uniref:hypothetical protein n=1 Tax=Meiothermus taiwanensis TaxID=172827 RepID=UPI000404BAB3
MTQYRVKVSTPQPKGRWRIARQWWPEPQEALVSPEELERLQADPLLLVEVLEEVEADPPKKARGK